MILLAGTSLGVNQLISCRTKDKGPAFTFNTKAQLLDLWPVATEDLSLIPNNELLQLFGIISIHGPLALSADVRNIQSK